MSSDAKAWKKDRLRACGVQVIEHDGDYGSAVAAGRAQAMVISNVYFVDDKISERLFFGYSVAAMRLKRQLSAHGIEVNAELQACEGHAGFRSPSKATAYDGA